MENIISRLDVTQIFGDVDDFCQQWQSIWQEVPPASFSAVERRKAIAAGATINGG